MKKYNSILLILSIICISVTIQGCRMFYTISSDDIINKKVENKIKIVLNDKKEIIVENFENIIISDTNEIIVLQNDSTRVTLSKDEIKKYMEERFSFGKTFFASLWITGLTFFAVLVLFVLIYGPLRVG